MERQQILKFIADFELQHNIRVLYACESGSKAWGFASAESDFDVRMIYVRPVEDYISLVQKPDAFDDQKHDVIDAGAWDVRKAADLIWRSNPPIREWFNSEIVYRDDYKVVPLMMEASRLYFCPVKSIYHYGSMARGVWKDMVGHEVKRKKYLYALRPLACARFISLHKEMPPTKFEDVVSKLDWTPQQVDAISKLVHDKKSGVELGMGPIDPVLHPLCSEGMMWTESPSLTEGLSPRTYQDMEKLDIIVQTAILGHRVK